MKALSMLALLLTHPVEFRTLVQFWLYHEQKRDISAQQEHPTSGWDRKSMRRCWEFLDQTSRSFSAVIKELDGDLARTICLFYLVLRALDTIEDDMSIPAHVKQSLLRSFHQHTVTPGWTFKDSGPNEKDRQVLVEYDTVVEEVNRLAPEYKCVILDICLKMETGMADYAHKAATTGSIYIETVAEYDLYCHYVAGLVGEGLSRIWSASSKEPSFIGEQLELSNSMGLLLQKTNIIRDYREDVEESRFFWPREIWGQYEFNEMRDMCHPGVRERARWVQSGMVLDALRHATDSLDYLRLLKNQSIFTFCAIPATMAMATLALCFGNADMFQKNVKIRKAEAAKLIMQSTNPRDVAYIFRDYSRTIHAKSIPTDPNFIRISVACGKIEQWCEHHYPSFVRISQTASMTGSSEKLLFDSSDARTRIVEIDQKRDANIARRKHGNGIQNGRADVKSSTSSKEAFPLEVVLYILAAFTIVLGGSLGAVYGILYYLGDA